MKLFCLALLCFANFGGTRSENFLFFFGLSTYSHRVVAWPIVEALADKGHNVTFLQPFENKNPHPKVKDIVTPVEFRDEMEGFDFVGMRSLLGSGMQVLNYLISMNALSVCENVLKNPENQKWIESSEFDVVVVDGLFNDCGFVLAHKFNAKVIVLGPNTVFTRWIDGYGLPSEMSSIPEIYISTQYGSNMGLLAKISATLSSLVFHVLKSVFTHWPMESMARKYLKNMEDMPSIEEIERNTSLVLINSHFSEEFPRSLPPLVVPIGGIHCKESEGNLPQTILDFIGNDKFIFVSFGSAIKIGLASTEKQDIFINAFRNMSDMKFVWKWESERPKRMPKNVFTSKWMPQQDILAHPQASGFITHGGLLGTQEAVYHAVPMIVFPVFAEQDYNAYRVSSKDRGISLEIGSLTSVELEQAVRKLTSDPKYQENMNIVSKRFKDRQQTPLESAMWWIEYVLRNENSHEFLMPLSANQYWFQKRLLDVWACIAIFLAIELYIAKLLIGWCLLKCGFFKSKGKEKIKTN